MRARRVSFVLYATGALFAAAGAFAAPGAEDPAMVIRGLNQDYVTAFLKSDVERYRQLLADDFAAILSNGNLVNRAAFLEAASQPAKVGFFELLDVEVRVSGSFAVVRARTSFRRADGSAGQNRYSNVYALRSGKWVVV